METLNVDINTDGSATVTDDAGRTARLNADQWAFIQARRLAIRSQYGAAVAENWYLQVLCFHALAGNK